MQNHSLEQLEQLEKQKSQELEKAANADLQRLLTKSTKLDKTRRAPTLQEIWQRLNHSSTSAPRSIPSSKISLPQTPSGVVTSI
jgi:copper homeostasis protein CutC